MALEQLGRSKEAIKHYQNCLERAPGAVQARQRMDNLPQRPSPLSRQKKASTVGNASPTVPPPEHVFSERN